MPIEIQNSFEVVKTVYRAKSITITANQDNSFVIDIQVVPTEFDADGNTREQPPVSHTIPPDRVASAPGFDSVRSALSSFIYADFQAHVLNK